ncbi:MAG: magnesium/cobalt transporter CorA [Kouleothrix sp.]|nr:magnesium/cobalt transporter CorA [Kouleothrix sp.]
MSEIVNCAAYAEGRRARNVEIDQVGEALELPGQFVWIGLHEPGEELLRQVQRQFNLHDLAIEDAHCAHQRPKLEQYGDSLFVVLRTAHVDRGEITFGETHIFIGERYIVSVRHGVSLPYVDVRARVETTPQLLRKGPAFVLYALMDFIVDQYFPIVDVLEQELQQLEDKIFGESFNRETTTQIYHLQSQLLEVKRVVSPLIDICNRLTRFDYAIIPEGTQLYFRDIYDHVVRINEMVDTLRELLTTALEAAFSLISIAQNDVMKRFAGWGAILALPTMIAGVYGMNFQYMPELGWQFGYPMMAAVTLTLCGVLYWRFKRSGWL